MTAQLGVDNTWINPCPSLSHGQRPTIAIIRALRKPFRLLLLDEPFSHLDEENQILASRLIQEVTEANDAGLILSSLGSSPALSFDQQISCETHSINLPCKLAYKWQVREKELIIASLGCLIGTTALTALQFYRRCTKLPEETKDPKIISRLTKIGRRSFVNLGKKTILFQRRN